MADGQPLVIGENNDGNNMTRLVVTNDVGFNVSADDAGMRGESNVGRGVVGNSGSGPGTTGSSWSGDGVEGTSILGFGMVGTSFGSQDNPAGGVLGQSNVGTGVTGQSNSGLAGEFLGSVVVEGDIFVNGGDLTVVGTLGVTGVKQFKIDHPLDPTNKYLNHSSVEAPDMKTIYDGIVDLDEDGAAWVDLPEWFEPLNRDYRYQLTAIGASAPAMHIAQEISHNRFKIAGGKPNMRVSWQVTGTRQDRWAEANRFEVEEEKAAEERGRYLHPEIFGQPEELGIGRSPRRERQIQRLRQRLERLPSEPPSINLERPEEQRRRLEEIMRQMRGQIEGREPDFPEG